MKALQVTHFNQVLDLFIRQPNPVVEITQPDHRIMVVNRSILLEPKTVGDGLIVSIPLLDI